jgi:hypothetical protein
METTLTIPKTRIGPSLALASIGSLACVGPSQGMLTALLDHGIRSTGSNVAWLEGALPEFAPAQTEDLYVLSIQRLKSLTSKVQDVVVARSDRDSLLEVKEVLSLTGTQLSKAMGASRTSLYQWIDESKTMRPKSRKRLKILKDLSQRWSGRVGVPISRSPWVSGADRARLAEILAAKSGNNADDAQALLDELAGLKPATKPSHRSILEIARERKWKSLPDYIRQAERDSRLPSARSTPGPS